MKKLMVRYTLMTAISFGLLACGKGFEAATFKAPPANPIDLKTRNVGDPADPKAANAFSLDTGKVSKHTIVYTDQVHEVPSAYSEIKGRLQVSQFKFQFDEKTRDLTILGDLNVGASAEGKPLAFSMHGKMLPQKSTYMKVTDEKSPLLNLLAAKVTCVTEDCKDFLVDFAYKVEAEKSFYVVRVNNITPKPEVIEDFPTKETSPKSEPVQGQETTKAPAKSATAAPAPEPLKPAVKTQPALKAKPLVTSKPATTTKPVVAPKAPVAPVKSKTPVISKSTGLVAWFKDLTTSKPTIDRSQKPSPQLNTGRIRKANEPRKDTQTKPIRKADPVAVKPADQKPVVVAAAKPSTPPEVKAPTISVEEESGSSDEAVLEDSDDVATQADLADSDLKPIDIVAMFPELKEEKDKADKNLADQRAKEGTSLPPEMNPSAFLKSLGGNKNLSPSVQQVLASIPAGLNQAVQVVQVTGRKKVIQRRLQNSVNLVPLVAQLDPHSGLRILHPEQNNFWGTSELVSTVLRIGQWVLDNVGDVQLDVADLSDQNGGLQVHKGTHIRTHRSHQHGVDVDLGYVIAKNNEVGRMRVPLLKSDDFLIDKQWELFRELFKEDIAQQIYVSAPVKRALCQHLKQTHELQDPQIVQYSNRIAVVAGHENHFHLRIKCGPGQTLCGPALAIRPSPCR